MNPAQQPVARWRPSVLALVTMAVGVLLFAAIAVGCAVGYVQSADGRASWAFMALYFVAWTVGIGLLTRTRIDLFRDRVELVRWFGFQVKVIPLADIAETDVGRYGLNFRLHNDEVVSGPAAIGQKGVGLELIGYKNRGDKIAATIMQSVEHCAPPLA